MQLKEKTFVFFSKTYFFCKKKLASKKKTRTQIKSVFFLNTHLNEITS